jgi:hypothetical protein
MDLRPNRHRVVHSIAGVPMAEVDQQGEAKPGNPKTQTDHRGHGIDVRT